MRRARTSPRARAGAAAGRPRRAAIGVILLAAGGSSRMGRPKQALRIAQRDAVGSGESLLRHAARAAVESAGRPVVVVLGATGDALASDIADLPVHAVDHSGWARGIRIIDQGRPRVSDRVGACDRRRHRLRVRPTAPLRRGVEPSWPDISRVRRTHHRVGVRGDRGRPRTLRSRGLLRAPRTPRSRWCTRADRARHRANRHRSVSARRDRSGYAGGVRGLPERRAQGAAGWTGMMGEPERADNGGRRMRRPYPPDHRHRDVTPPTARQP